MQRNQLRHVLGALTITAMALLLILAFGRMTNTTNRAAADDVAALQAENTQLRQTIQTLQTREQQYQGEIQRANDTINLLIDAANLSGVMSESSLPALDADTAAGQQVFLNTSSLFDDDDDEDEHAEESEHSARHAQESVLP
ncbi:MAG: hypothetical protein WAZ19_14790 [Anaerolineae bacterium]